MGKKSRRKKGAKKDVGVGQEEPLLASTEQNNNDASERILDSNGRWSPSRPKRPFFVGDRVWFVGNTDIAHWDNYNPNTYRGFVSGVRDDELDIITLQAKYDGRDDIVCVNVEFVYPDWSDMTLRFDVGDRVLINTATIDSPKWISSTIDRIWPIEHRNNYTNITADNDVVHYLCGTYLIPSDHNEIIVEHPASIRFKIGDNVMINSSKAIQFVKKAKDLSKKNDLPDNWVNAIVVAVDVMLFEEGNQTNVPKMYAVYACSFEINGKSKQCYIGKDDDEHIAGADSVPRERLFEAIDQDCSLEHLSYLTSFYSIDISLFREMVIDRAVASASFNALLWLQECHSVSMDKIHDEHGNNLMHQIATSDKATHFIKEVARGYKFGKKHGRVLDVLNRYGMGRLTSFETNRNGETWLHVLVKNGNVNAFDAALSPKSGFAWWMTSVYTLDAEKTQSLKECVESIGDVLITAIFQQFLSLRKWKKLYDDLHSKSQSSEAESQAKDELAILQGSSGKRNAKKFIRFWQDWSGGDELRRNPFLVLVEKGHANLFRLFFEANKDFFVNDLYRVYPKCNQQEFIQPELSTHHSKFPLLNERADIVSIAMIGSSGHVPYGWTSDEYIETKKRYFCQLLFAHVENCTSEYCASWLAHLKLNSARFKYIDHRLEPLAKYKVSLLEDDDALIGRLEILKYLLHDTTVIAKYTNNIHNPPPKNVITMNIMTTIRFRQCGVLKFLVEMQHLVQLDEVITMEGDYVKNYVDTFHFTVNSSMLNGYYFCLAAVEFDDLYSLQWLVTKVGCPVVSFDGFNILHLSSYLGRIEIIAWLHTTDVWESLVEEVSTRQPYDNCTAVYIAAGEGHILVVELLMKLGCEVNDRTLNEYARKSGQAFVQKWVDDREGSSQPSALELDIMKLQELLAAKDSSSEDLKKHIVDTKCLSIKSWNGISCYRYDSLSSFDMSFSDIINKCCKHDDRDFVVWLCVRISFWDGESSYERFWDTDYRGNLMRKLLDHDDLTTLSKKMGFDKVTQILSKKWTKNVKCLDPSASNLFSLSALEDDEILSSSVHSKLLYANVLMKLSDRVRRQINYMLRHGGSCEDISDLLHVNEKLRSCLKEEGYFLKDFQLNWDINIIVKNEVLNIEFYSYMETYADVEKRDDHPLRRTNFVYDRQLGDLSNIHIVLATEGYTELIYFCRKNFRGWTVDAELEAAYVAAYFGQDEIVGMFLCSPEDVSPPLLSDINERFAMILLGAGESGHYQDLHRFISLRKPPFDPIKFGKRDDAILKDLAQKSLAVAIFSGILRKTHCDIEDKSVSEVFNLLEFDLSYSVGNIFYSMEVSLQLVKYDITEGECIERFIEVFRLMGTRLAIEPVFYHQQMQSFTKLVVEFVFDRMRNIKSMSDDEKEAFKSLVLSWLEDLASAGIDVQDLQPQYRVTVEVDFLGSLESLQKKQREYWAQFDIVKKQPISEIQSKIENGYLGITGRDKGGSTLLHLTAAYNRADVSEWLVVTKGMDMNALDGSGRTPLQCAVASSAVDTVDWISVYMAKQTIQSFVCRNYKRVLMQRKQQEIKNAAMTIQKVVRGRLSRKIYRGPLLLRLGESQQFNEIWMDAINKVPTTCDSLSGWSLVREELDVKRRMQLLDDNGNLTDLDERLGQAVTGALNGNNEIIDEYEKEEADFNTDFSDDLTFDKEKCTSMNEECIDWTQFQMTSHVVKFIKHGDPKYREIFVKRLKQLAKGERSHKLQKPLKGCDSIIFETYLEQKSGFRILWTEESTNPSSSLNECSDTSGGNIIIWFVAKHKSVSRLAKLIDDAKDRSHSRLAPEDILSREEIDDGNLHSQPVLIDPLGNVPLKLYDVQFQSIDDIATNTWTPQMHLTEEECEVVQAKGTVLLLGRSGTGKTVCIINRMEFDRHNSGLDPTFSQLFVSRSNRLCRYVEGAVGNNDRTTFSTFDKLLYRLEAAFSSSENNNMNMSFLPSSRVSFSRFRREFFAGLNQRNLPDALIVWKNIKTYLRGSLEAHQSPGQVLSNSDFTSGILGKNRCRLSPDLRECVYDVFLKYEQYKQAGKLWDDCDRVCCILKRLDEVKRVDPLVFDEVRESKIYVDEVQDYTQIEVLLFFYLSGPGGLFLVGDPAQSVVEGTDFRFEDIRSVGYYIAGNDGSGQRDLIPSKPKKVNVNFRSHRGILNTASSILDFLFATFPSAAKQLEKDDGLFDGSRPGFNYNVNIKQLSKLLSGKLNGTVVLTADESASHWRRSLDYELVIGVRAAKGLEFKSVIILDFFGELPSSIQKAWRDLLLNRADPNFERDYPLVETYLKLLYVAVTRCIERLLFVETSSSIAGDAAIRWLCKKDGALATQNNVMDVEGMTLTADEFVSQGLDYIQTAESPESEFDEAMTQIGRAIYCFEQAQDSQLASKARVHRLSAQFRSDLSQMSMTTHQESTSEASTMVIEAKGAQIVAQLLSENLLEECKSLIQAISPFVSAYAQAEIERRITRNIQR